MWQRHVTRGGGEYLISISMFLLVNINFPQRPTQEKIAHNTQLMKSTQNYERQTSWRWIVFWVLLFKMFPLILGK